MPVKCGNGKDGGCTWGKAGTQTKLTASQAAAVGRAAHANGYKGGGSSPSKGGKK